LTVAADTVVCVHPYTADRTANVSLRGVTFVTKKDLIRSVSQDADVDQKLVQVVVQKTLDMVLDTIAKEGRAELRNFGVFEVKQRAARKARNPRTGEQVDVAEKHVVTFNPRKAMQQRIENRKQQHDVPASKE
jgi:nucleoid DNA-binding protein